MAPSDPPSTLRPANDAVGPLSVRLVSGLRERGPPVMDPEPVRGPPENVSPAEPRSILPESVTCERADEIKRPTPAAL